MTIKLPTISLRTTALDVRADALPDGICGRVSGIALRYNVLDSYGTMFLPGSLDKTRAKVAAGKVKLFDNHGAADSYGTRSHIGVLRSLVTVGDAEMMSADLFDTEDGRRAKEYLTAVMAAGAETGLSIGFFERAGDGIRDANGNWYAYGFSEVELDETSLAPRQAVPGALVTGVRKDADNGRALRALLRNLCAVHGADTVLDMIREQDDNATDGDEPGAVSSEQDTNVASGDEPTPESRTTASATMAERLMAVRSTYATRG